jgi:hypothetical protein
MQIHLDIFFSRPKDRRCDVSQSHDLQDLRQDLVMELNNNNKLELTFFKGTAVVERIYEHMNITGWTIDFIVKSQPTDSDEDAILKYTITDLPEAINGRCTIRIPIEDLLGSSNIAPIVEGTYLYSIKATTTKPIIKTVKYGLLTMQKSLFD